jgi:hypothetical protein
MDELLAHPQELQKLAEDAGDRSFPPSPAPNSACTSDLSSE